MQYPLPHAQPTRQKLRPRAETPGPTIPAHHGWVPVEREDSRSWQRASLARPRRSFPRSHPSRSDAILRHNM
jgi:hypothetical protein